MGKKAGRDQAYALNTPALVRIERAPTVRWNELVTGYELRKFIVALE